MRLKLIAALRRLNRQRLRRRVLIESARLEEMEKNAETELDTQRTRVQDAEAALDRALDKETSISSAEIACRLDRECKAALLA